MSKLTDKDLEELYDSIPSEKPLSSHAVLGKDWRDVRKELPKSDNRVIVYPYYRSIGHYTVHSTKIWINENGEDIGDVVKAWMPIPDPPFFVR
jgi:hypothetical protein